MGYWSNGTEGRDWEAAWCERCVHQQEDAFCPVMELHEDWNGEQIVAINDRYHGRPVSDPVSEAKFIALETLISRSADGLTNTCRMFHPRTTESEREARDAARQREREAEWMRARAAAPQCPAAASG